MGRLIETKHTEINATLERLDEFGVTTAGLKKIRIMSPVLLKQLVYIIENGLPKTTDVLPGMCTFDVMLDSTNIDLIWDKVKKHEMFQPPNQFFRRVLEESSRLPVVRKKFITLSLKDLGLYKSHRLTESLSSATWLKAWSEENLLGQYHVVPCERRPDLGIHIALTMNSVEGCHPRPVVINGELKEDWFTVGRIYNSCGVWEKGIFPGRVDFSYDWPALFELKKV